MPLQPSNAHLTGLGLLAVTAIGWGLNWPAIKFVLADWPPLFSRGLSGIIAVALLTMICLARRERLRVPRNAILPLVAASFTNVFAWMGFTTVAMKSLTVAECALLVYTMPIWVTFLSWPILGIRLTLTSTLALALGSAGIFTLFAGQHIDFGTGKGIGVMLALGAAILFALGSILNREKPALAPFAFVTWQVGLACVPMTIIGLWFEQPDFAALRAPGWYALLYMALIPMALCYVTWFGALRFLPAPTAAIGTLAVPVIGVVSAALMLGEPLGTREIIAVALTIAGVWLALKPQNGTAEAA